MKGSAACRFIHGIRMPVNLCIPLFPAPIRMRSIKECMNTRRVGSGIWAVPYLPIDPSDVGRTYESIIRINSQSGKGGVAYVMEKDFGFKLPKEMQPEFGKVIQEVTDREGRELLHNEIFQTFENEYLTLDTPI